MLQNHFSRRFTRIYGWRGENFSFFRGKIVTTRVRAKAAASGHFVA
jgi:hypothetical protein